jgi:hypothetical protein
MKCPNCGHDTDWSLDYLAGSLIERNGKKDEQLAQLRAENARLVAELEAARIIIIDMVHEANLQDAFDDDSGCAIMEQAKDFLALSEKYLL